MPHDDHSHHHSSDQKIDDEPAHQPHPDDHHQHGHSCSHDHSHASDAASGNHKLDVDLVADKTDLIAAAGSVKSLFSIENMDCPTEEALIRNKFANMDGISKLHFNLMQRKLTVIHLPDQLTQVQSALNAIGMDAVLLEDAASIGSNLPAQSQTSSAATRKKWILLAIAGAAALIAEVIALVSGSDRSWPIVLLCLCAIGLSGLGTYKKGWIALKNANLNINALMSIAVTGAVVLQQWPEAAMVMVLFTLAEMIEALSLDRARNAIRGLMAMTPEQATVLQADGKWEVIAAASAQLGASIRVAPGERIPLDGLISKGQSSVNQAPITGESMPVEKVPGDKVFAGTINQTGSFDYTVTALQNDSTMSRIIHAVEEAQASKAPTQGFVDRFAKIYTPCVFLIALAIAIVPPLAMGLPWMIWFYKALVLLVIACPCALVVSTPVTVVSGLSAAAKAGILIKGGRYLEEGRYLKSIALDKTGTITQGKPKVTDVVVMTGTEEDSLRLAAQLAARSDHPMSLAIHAYWREKSGDVLTGEVTEFEALTGRGIKGRIAAQYHYLGNHRLIEELGICNPEIETALNRLEAEGKSVVMLSNDMHVIALVAVADAVRDTSRAAIAELHQLGIRTVMLTGDNTLTAKSIARQTGIDDARGNLLPEDKLAAIKQETAEYRTVGMVGDGINDAPALAQANIGFAMGAAGSDTALETADVALMDDDLRKIPQFIRLSRSTSAILKQNIAIALGIKIVFFVMAMMGVATLWMAVFADMGASLIVVFNGLRLLRWKQTEYKKIAR
ncbi:heavy metal translocating P-type ATPase [Undibacterium sp. Xuan67W]|uniref:heavy metal translocating P-type ATPase n=1 Tax=Undibacterium sp. Xuan67W TaxID=3413057 RepID=UPI003BF35416